MATSDPYDAWSEDAELLAQIGRALSRQPTRLTVRLPRDLADRAVGSWNRDDFDGELPPETAGQRLIRNRAGAVGLIGLSIEQTGQADGEEVIVELDTWYVGDALRAADDAGLLADERPPAP